MRCFTIIFGLLQCVVALCAVDVITVGKSDGGLTASGSSTSPALSANGRYVVFVSSAGDLTTNRTDRIWLNIFRRDLVTSNTVLVSTTPSGRGGNGNSTSATISSNGQYVAFVSDASDLVSGDTNAGPDVFVRDIDAGVTRLVTQSPDGAVSLPVRNYRNTAVPMISEDGRRVAFETLSTNLVHEVDTNGRPDVVVADLARSANVPVTKRWDAQPATLTDGSRLVGFSTDGERVAFLTRSAEQIEPSAPSGGAQVFVRTVTNSLLQRVSTFDAFYTNAYECAAATLSGDGRFLAMVVVASNYPSRLFHRDVDGESVTLVASNVGTNAPFISQDGRYIGFEDGTNVYRWDADSSATHLVNFQAAATQGRSVLRGMSADGEKILFVSDSPDTSTNGSNGGWQIHWRSMNTEEASPVALVKSGFGGSVGVSMSTDGRMVAFDSAADDVTGGDRNGRSDVFVRDVSGNVTGAISLGHPGATQGETATGHAYLNSSCISSNGEYILISSLDSDLIPNDTNEMADLFLVSTVDNSIQRVLSDVRFTSFALSGLGRHFLYVGETGQVVRVECETGSRVTMQGPARVLESGVPAISFDGAKIAYRHAGGFQICDAGTGSVLFSTNGYIYPVRSGLHFHDNSRDALFTPNSQLLLFYNPWLWMWNETGGARMAQGGVMWGLPAGMQLGAVSAQSRFMAGYFGNVIARYDLVETNVMSLGSFPHQIVDYSISGDGSVVVGSTSNSRPQVVFGDFGTRESGYISTTPAGISGNGRSYAPTISANGRYIAYLSDATDIVPGNTNGMRQVLLRDRMLGTTVVLSASPSGAPGDYHSSRPMFSIDGSTLVFLSMADNLVAGDGNERRDIFVVKPGGADSDNDGLDDDWEVAYFGDLTHSGSADTDLDGASDRDEFLAGTDPTNGGSVFRVLVVAQIGSPNKQLVWSGTSSRSYRVEYKDDLSTAAWTALNAPITWTGTTASVIDSASVPTRFYRVVLLP